MSSNIYAELGVKPVVNAMGNVTLLGGSIQSPGVQAATQAANEIYVSIEELLDRSGQAAADMLGAERAYITSGAFAALVQGIAGIMAGDDPQRIAQLPDSSGMKNEFLIQKKTRYRYDRCITAAGGKMVEIGDEEGTTLADLEAAIGPQTVGILYFARDEGKPGVLPLAQVIEVAQRTGIRVVVDAAGEVYPLERLRGLPSCGADLICYGAKYLGAPNSSGILCGSADAVDAARLNGFSSYEALNNRSMGRGYKVDRQEIVGVVAALREWIDMDHEERLQEQADRIDAIMVGLDGLPHVAARNVWDEEGGAWMRMRIVVDADALGRSVEEIATTLKAGDPSILVRIEQGDLVLAVHTLREGETGIVRDGLRAALSNG